jgi:hypothetical protein
MFAGEGFKDNIYLPDGEALVLNSSGNRWDRPVIGGS